MPHTHQQSFSVQQLTKYVILSIYTNTQYYIGPRPSSITYHLHASMPSYSLGSHRQLPRLPDATHPIHDHSYPKHEHAPSPLPSTTTFIALSDMVNCLNLPSFPLHLARVQYHLDSVSLSGPHILKPIPHTLYDRLRLKSGKGSISHDTQLTKLGVLTQLCTESTGVPRS